MLTDMERQELGVTRQLPQSPNEAFKALLDDELLAGSIGKELVGTYVTIQKLYNEKLDEVGPYGHSGRKTWLKDRI